MPRWYPEPFWSGEDVIILGGGPSLEGFDFGLLRSLPVIGCNRACTLGSDIVDICIFGDVKWWEKEGKELTSSYSGLIVSNSPALLEDPPERVLVMRRTSKGLDPQALAWNGNTGSAALNLALILGARIVYLLGFDLKSQGQKTHWHEGYGKDVAADKYTQFLRGFVAVKNSLTKTFPGREVVNVNDDSSLTCFPIMPISVFAEKIRRERKPDPKVGE